MDVDDAAYLRRELLGGIVLGTMVGLLGGFGATVIGGSLATASQDPINIVIYFLFALVLF